MTTHDAGWSRKNKGLLAIALVAALMLLGPTIAASQPIAKAVLTLGNNQTGKVLEYQSGKRSGDGGIRYEAKIDGNRRVVTYRALPNEKALVVSIDDGAGGAAMKYKLRAIPDAGATDAAFTYQKIEWIIEAAGQIIAQTTTDKNDKEVLIRLNKGARYDAYSMDVLLHLPSEVAGLDPAGNQPGIEAQGLFGKILKWLGGLLTGGAKWERDCQKTTEKFCQCSAACMQAPGTPPGDCSCADCCGICCSGSCTQEERVVKNCSQTVSVGKD
ncbi:MAG: hypothetical protein JNJ94_11130 [Chlorobi bacterium]|nr:hypothetical protein [Chlorobiota bacterium]